MNDLKYKIIIHSIYVLKSGFLNIDYTNIIVNEHDYYYINHKYIFRHSA